MSTFEESGREVLRCCERRSKRPRALLCLVIDKWLIMRLLYTPPPPISTKHGGPIHDTTDTLRGHNSTHPPQRPKGFKANDVAACQSTVGHWNGNQARVERFMDMHTNDVPDNCLSWCSIRVETRHTSAPILLVAADVLSFQQRL